MGAHGVPCNLLTHVAVASNARVPQPAAACTLTASHAHKWQDNPLQGLSWLVYSVNTIHMLTMPTLCPGWNLVPRCLTSICPGKASCPCDILAPRYLGWLSALFLVLPPCFLVALQAPAEG